MSYLEFNERQFFEPSLCDMKPWESNYRKRIWSKIVITNIGTNYKIMHIGSSYVYWVLLKITNMQSNNKIMCMAHTVWGHLC